MVRNRSLSVEYAQLQPEVVAAFGGGATVASLASRYRVTVQTVERLIRRAMLERDQVAGRADQHEAARERRPVNRSGRGGSGRRRLSRPTA